jgi:hypothetical protein
MSLYRQLGFRKAAESRCWLWTWLRDRLRKHPPAAPKLVDASEKFGVADSLSMDTGHGPEKPRKNNS